MNRALVVSLTPLLLLASCSSCNKDQPAKVGDDAAASADATGADGKAEGKRGIERAPGPPEVLVFKQDGWSGARGPCSENMTPEGCDSEWRHEATRQLARVFLVPVKDDSALSTFMARLAADVKQRGALVERIDQGKTQVLRYLERSRAGVNGVAIDVASINYVLVGRDQKAVHIVTSVVPFAEQQPADERLRALLDSASWTTQ